MKLARGVAVFAILVGLSASLPRSAAAMGAVVGQPGEQVSLASVRLAVAVSPSRTTRWAQVSVQGASAGFVWLVPVRPGARVDLASDAWLDALDAATAPVILPPTTPPECALPLAPSSIAAGATPVSGSPTRMSLFFDADSLNTFVSGAGFAVPMELADPIGAAFGSGVALAAFVYASADVATHTLRIVDDGAPSFSLALSPNPMGQVPVTAFVVGSTRQSAGAWTLTVDPASVLWQADGQSTYTSVRSAALEQGQGEGWLVEDAAQGLLFQGTPVPSGPSLLAVLGAYYTFANTYGDTTQDPSACTAAATATASEPSTYASACPAGGLVVVPGMSPCSVSGPDTIAVEPLTCGIAVDDAALAVAALSPESIWVTRLDGIVTPESANEVPLQAAPPVALSAVVTSGGYAATCGPSESPPTGSGSSSSGSSSSSSDNGAAASDAASAAADGCAAGLDSCDSSDTGDDSGGCDSGSSDDSGGCSGGSDSSGCSGSDSSTTCTAARHTHAKGHSPVSRVALVAACVAVFLRRRRRPLPRCGGYDDGAYGIDKSSTSNTSVEPGGTLAPAPRSP